MNTPDNITELKPNQIFVFGSNLLWQHWWWAARLAYEKFWAKMWVGEWLTWQCYAFPTLDENYNQLDFFDLGYRVANLYITCSIYNDHEFILTKVWCWIAWFEEEDMKNLFRDSPKNLIKPKWW